jgi:hypothetical protein
MTLARRFVWELIVLWLISVMPCATAGGNWQGGSVVDDDGHTGADASLSSAVDLTGRWEGTWHSQGGAAGSSLTALLTQVEASLTGVVTIPDVACLPAGTVSGSVDGDTVVFGIVSAEAVQANFTGTVVDGGLSMQGSYDVHDAACAVDVGTWQVVKVAEPCDANGDGTIDRRDAGDVLRFLLGRQLSLAGYADCNKDGTLNFRDVMAILQSR